MFILCRWPGTTEDQPAEIVLTQQLLRGPARLSPLLLCSHTCPVLCLQAQERIDKAVSDADAMESQYEAAYASARQTYSRGRALLDEIQRVGTCKSCAACRRLDGRGAAGEVIRPGTATRRMISLGTLPSPACMSHLSCSHAQAALAAPGEAVMMLAKP